MPKPIQAVARIERKDPSLPRFVVISSAAIASWKITETTTVTGTLDGHDLGRRELKKWDERRWFIELPQPLCQSAGVDTGDRVALELQIASDQLPVELASLIGSNPKAKQAWEQLTPGSQRMLREHVTAAKQASTRARRAAAGLGVSGCA